MTSQIIKKKQALRQLYRELDEAARNGDASGVRAMVERGTNPDGHPKFSRDPLSPAIRSGSLETVRVLLENGANVNAQTRNFCPLNWAVGAGSDAMVRLLLAWGATVNPEQPEHKPLMIAAGQGYDGLTNLLLNYGADVHAATVDGLTALTFAAMKDHRTTVRLLQERGARTGILDAITLQDAVLHERFRRDEPIFHPPHWGATLLAKAADAGDTERVHQLLGAGIDVNARTRAGTTALMVATFHGHIDVVRLLLERGANPNLRTNIGERALKFAVQRQHEEIARLLKQYRARR